MSGHGRRYRKRLKHKDSRTYNAQEMLEIFATSKVTKLAAANAAEVRDGGPVRSPAIRDLADIRAMFARSSHHRPRLFRSTTRSTRNAAWALQASSRRAAA